VAKITPPPGVVTAKINPETGLRDAAGTVTEQFLEEQLPPEQLPPEPENKLEDKLEDVIRSTEDIIREFFSH
jgi:penicillin-binding protein 1A